jgi:glucose-6-phosphate dehydrogenase assembly protein OpcA
MWRTLLAGILDTLEPTVTGVSVEAPATDPTAALMRGWLGARLRVPVRDVTLADQPRMRKVELTCSDGTTIGLTRDNDIAAYQRTGHPDRILPLVRRPLGEELAEELRRLDADQVYAEALGELAGLTGLDARPPTRVHVWQDPAAQAAAA